MRKVIQVKAINSSDGKFVGKLEDDWLRLECDGKELDITYDSDAGMFRIATVDGVLAIFPRATNVMEVDETRNFKRHK